MHPFAENILQPTYTLTDAQTTHTHYMSEWRISESTVSGKMYLNRQKYRHFFRVYTLELATGKSNGKKAIGKEIHKCFICPKRCALKIKHKIWGVENANGKLIYAYFVYVGVFVALKESKKIEWIGTTDTIEEMSKYNCHLITRHSN